MHKDSSVICICVRAEPGVEAVGAGSVGTKVAVEAEISTNARGLECSLAHVKACAA